MRTAILALILLSRCSGENEKVQEGSTEGLALNTQDNLLEEIERRIELPSGAFELSEYARFYALENRRVIAVYSTHSPQVGSEHGITIGKRGWVDTTASLPFILDGGCSMVNVVYNLDSKSFDEVFCNGEA